MNKLSVTTNKTYRTESNISSCVWLSATSSPVCMAHSLMDKKVTCPGRLLRRARGAPAISRSLLLAWGISVVQPPSPCWYIHQCPLLTMPTTSPLGKQRGILDDFLGVWSPSQVFTLEEENVSQLIRCAFPPLFFFFPHMRGMGRFPSLLTRTNRCICCTGLTGLERTELHVIMFILNLDIFPNFLTFSLSCENA